MLVSILIPCYNARQWIAQAIESALAQTWEDKEVIVVDDGSTDGSLEIIRRFGARICWEATPNRGGNVARNRLLELSKGEWLQYLDADDYLLPCKVERQMAFLAEHPSTDVVFGPVVLEHCEDGKSWQEMGEFPQERDPWVLLANWDLPQTGSPLWRKRSIIKAGGWKPDQPCCQEHELYLRLLISGARFEYLGDPGVVYRQWSMDTVCRRDTAEVYRRRLEVKLRMEKYLEAANLLTLDRQSALNQARFKVARMVWRYDPQAATAIVRHIRQRQPGFAPYGPAAPPRYRLVYRFLGFRAAEWLADCRRLMVWARPKIDDNSNRTVSR